MKRPRAGCPGGRCRLAGPPAGLRTRPLGLCPQNTRGLKPMSLIAKAALRIEPDEPPTAQRPSRPATEPVYQLIRRNGTVTPFDASKIAVALTKAFLAVEGN